MGHFQDHSRRIAYSEVCRRRFSVMIRAAIVFFLPKNWKLLTFEVKTKILTYFDLINQTFPHFSTFKPQNSTEDQNLDIFRPYKPKIGQILSIIIQISDLQTPKC